MLLVARDRGTQLAVQSAVRLDLRDRVLALDPGLDRLRAGLRAFATVTVTLGVLGLAHVSASVLLITTSIAMMTSILATDLITTLLVVPVASLAVCLGALATTPRVGGVVMVATTFAASYAKRFGERGTALGVIGFLAVFEAILVHRTPAALLGQTLAIAVAAGVSALMRFVVVRDRAVRIAAHMARALEARARMMLLLLVRWLRAPGRREDRIRARVNEALEEFEDTALALEESEKRDRVFAIELTVERLVEQGRELALHGTRAERHAFATEVESTVDRWRDGETPRLSSVPLGEAANEPGPPLEEPEARNQALQATISGALACVIGYLVAPDRWAWAVFGSFVVFNRTRTRGETLLRAWQRVIGTAMGVLFGAAIAAILAGHTYLELATILAFVFFAYYSVRTSYAWSMAFMSALFALLYALLGRLTAGILLVRVEETVVGAVCGALVASILRPTKTHDHVRENAASVLHAAADRLRSLAGGPRVSRGLELRLQHLRTAARPTTHALAVRAAMTSRLARHVAVVVYVTKHLATAPFREACDAIAHRAELVDAIADALDGTDLQLPHHDDETEPRDPETNYWLARLDAALEGLIKDVT